MTNKKSREKALAALARRIEMWGSSFGITRMDYPHIGKGWWVRLGWSKKKGPAFQQMLYDADHGGKEGARDAAAKLRDRIFVNLFLQGQISQKTPRPVRTRRNKTGIAGMSRQRTPSKTGAGYFWSWKVNWRENGKPRGRTFADSTYGGALESYRVAATFRMEMEFKLYGYSLINPQDIDDLFHSHFGKTKRKVQGSEQVDFNHLTLVNLPDYQAIRVVVPSAHEEEKAAVRYFPLSHYDGDFEKTREAACLWRDEQGRALYGESWDPATDRFLPKKPKSCASNTGHTGVSIVQTRRGLCAVAQWRTGKPGQRRTRKASASIAKYGEKEAIERVLRARDEAIMQDQQQPWRKDVAQAGKNLPALEKTEQGWSFWFGPKRYDFCEEDYQSLDGQPALFWAWLDAAGSLAELEIENGAIATFNTRIFKNLTLARQIFELALKSPSLT